LKEGKMKKSMMKKFRGKVSIVLLSFLTVFFLISATSQAADEIKIGLVSALTGPAGPVGQSHLAGAKVAVMHINEDGGIMGRKVVLVERDTAASPATALKVTRDLLMNQNVKLMTGVVSSAVALALPPLMEEQNGIMMIAAGQTEKVTGVNCNPHVFRICTHGVVAPSAMAKHAKERYPNIKRWGGVNPDYEFGHSCWRTFSRTLAKIDPSLTIVPTHFPKFGATNFEPVILKLLEDKVEGVYGVIYGNDFIAFAKQAQKYKLFDQVKVFLDHAVEMEVAVPLGFDMPHTWGGGHYNYKAYNNKLNQRFVEGHKKLFNGQVPVYAASETYSALYAYKYAIEKAKSTDTKEVIKALRGLSFDSVTGSRRIRPEDNQTEGTGIFTHFVPQKEAPGWKVTEYYTFPNASFIPKPSDPDGGCKMKW